VDISDRKARWFIVLSGLLCSLIFSASIPLLQADGLILGSDGIYYYVILRSFVFDGDYDYSNDFQLIDAPVIFGLTDEGIPRNPFAIGSALLWSPFFLIAHLASVLLVSFGIQVSVDGSGYIYQTAICYGTIVYATIGFLLTYEVGRRLFGSLVSLLAVLLMWWATPAIHYIVGEPSMSHGITLFTVSFFLWTWFPPQPTRTFVQWIGIGLATGLLLIGRWQDGILLVVPVIEQFWWIAKRRLVLGLALKELLVFALVVLVIFAPQSVMWHEIYGSWLTVPQGNDFFTWTNPQWLPTLISSRHGLLTWHPIFVFALVGLFPLWRHNKCMAIIVVSGFLAQLYINSSAEHWWADQAFGGRRFVSTIPLLTLSLAALLTTKQRSSYSRLVWSLCTILVIWNGLSFAQYRLGLVDKDAALTVREMTIDRLLLPYTLLERLLN
jgi:hypothetical protein